MNSFLLSPANECINVAWKLCIASPEQDLSPKKHRHNLLHWIWRRKFQTPLTATLHKKNSVNLVN